LPRYKFRWSNLPRELLDELCQALFVDSTGFEPAEVLQDAYGARPKEDFVAEAWEKLREGWLLRDKESRDQVVEAVRSVRHEDGQITNRRAQMEYLRGLRNAKNLRAVVLQAFIDRGEVEPETPVVVKPPPKPRPTARPTPQYYHPEMMCPPTS
jgi:hypothetical protein